MIGGSMKIFELLSKTRTKRTQPKTWHEAFQKSPFYFSKEELAQLKKESVKLTDEFTKGDIRIDNFVSPRLISYSKLFSLLKSFPWAQQCIDHIAQDTVRNGYDIHLEDGAKETTRDEIDAWLKKKNYYGHTPIDVLELFLDNLVGTSVGCIEILPDKVNKVSALKHVKSSDVRPHKYYLSESPSFPIFKCGVGTTTPSYLKRFGVKENYSVKTGREGEYTGEEAAHELIYVVEYDQEYFPYYGMPRIMRAFVWAYGLTKSSHYNVNFFKGVSAKYFAMLKGNFNETEIKKFELQIEKLGHDQDKQFMYLHSEDKETEAVLTPLRDKIMDASFLKYEDSCIEAIGCGCYGVPLEMIGLARIGSLGGNIVLENAKQYVRSTLSKTKRIVEDIINECVIRNPMGFNSQVHRFELKTLDYSDKAFNLQRANEAFDRKGLNIGEYMEQVELPCTLEDAEAEERFLSSRFTNPQELAFQELMENEFGKAMKNIQKLIKKAE